MVVQDVPRKILLAARQIGLAEGVSAIASRQVAQTAGVSPSAVNFHFGSRLGLLSALHRDVREDQFKELLQGLDSVSKLPSFMQSATGFIGAMFGLLAHGSRQRTLLLLELDLDAATRGELVNDAGDEFWHRFGECFDLDAASLWKWRMLLESAVWVGVLDRTAMETNSWLSAVLGRFTARLEGQADFPAARDEDGAPMLSWESDGPGKHPTAVKIIDAAVRLLSQGTAITHRKVAAEAGVPLASTTYFFASKTDMLTDAYRAIYSKLMEQTARRGLIGEVFSADGTLKPSYVLYGRLILGLARDDDLRSLAGQLRNVRGRSSMIGMHKSGYLQADRLDGLLWSLCHGAFSPKILSLPLGERPGFFKKRLTEVATSLFPLLLL